MRAEFPMLDSDTASHDAATLLTTMRLSKGMLCNLDLVMAAAPPLLAAYKQISDLFDQTAFTPAERQIVLHMASTENQCEYCVAWHTALARRSGLSAEDGEALRAGTSLSNPKQNALRNFSAELIRRRGHISDVHLAAFLAHGWTPRQALEVLVGLGAKTLSNYASSLTQVPLDSVVEKFK